MGHVPKFRHRAKQAEAIKRDYRRDVKALRKVMRSAVGFFDVEPAVRHVPKFRYWRKQAEAEWRRNQRAQRYRVMGLAPVMQRVKERATDGITSEGWIATGRRKVEELFVTDNPSHALYAAKSKSTLMPVWVEDRLKPAHR